MCMKSDFLCSGCSQKLIEGDLSETAIDVSRTLFKLSEKVPSLQTATIHQVITTADSLVILTGEGDGPKVVGKSGKIVKMLAEKTSKSVRVIENSNNFEEIIRGLIFPVQVQGINTLFSAGGEKKKVVISLKDKGRIPFNDLSFRNVVQKLTNREAVLCFE